LVNALGEVIGINTFIFTGDKKNRGSIGIGFAIPSSRAKRVAHELIEYGKRRTVWTGITVQDLDRSVALALGIEVTEGVVVTDVVKGSSGSDAGLLNSDVIVGMGGRLIKNHEDLEGFFVNYFVGDTVSIEIVRKSHRQKLLLTLREYPAKR
jgi:serine protease Do